MNATMEKALNAMEDQQRKKNNIEILEPIDFPNLDHQKIEKLKKMEMD